MNRFKNILFYAGTKTNLQAAANRAFKLAKSNNAKLTVVDVIEEVPSKIRNQFKVITGREIQQILIKEKVMQMEKLINPFRDKGVKDNTKVLIGKPFIEIIREVLRNKFDLVMKMAEGSGGLKTRLFGSIDMKLLRKCPCPVWIIKPTRRKRYARVLAAVDPDPYDKERDALNVLIMDMATSLAKMEKSELHVIHVWSLFAESSLRGAFIRMPESEIDKLLNKTKEEHKKLLGKVISKYSSKKLKPHVHLLKGKPDMVIPDIVKKKRMELIVMGTVGRGGLPGLLIGNTAETVLSQVDCSVLAVKPYNFITPVTLDK